VLTCFCLFSSFMMSAFSSLANHNPNKSYEVLHFEILEYLGNLFFVCVCGIETLNCESVEFLECIQLKLGI